MTTNDLYQMALADARSGEHGRHYGNGRRRLSDGSQLICGINKVAGRSQVVGHYRTTWHLVPVGEQYSKPISRDKAAALLKAECALAPQP